MSGEPNLPPEVRVAQAMANALNRSEERKWRETPDEFVIRDDSFATVFAEPLVLANLIGLMLRTRAIPPPPRIDGVPPWVDQEPNWDTFGWQGEILPKMVVRLRFELLRDRRSRRVTDTRPLLKNSFGDVFAWAPDEPKGVLLMNGQVLK